MRSDAALQAGLRKAISSICHGHLFLGGDNDGSSLGLSGSSASDAGTVEASRLVAGAYQKSVNVQDAAQERASYQYTQPWWRT